MLDLSKSTTENAQQDAEYSDKEESDKAYDAENRVLDKAFDDMAMYVSGQASSNPMIKEDIHDSPPPAVRFSDVVVKNKNVKEKLERPKKTHHMRLQLRMKATMASSRGLMRLNAEAFKKDARDNKPTQAGKEEQLPVKTLLPSPHHARYNSKTGALSYANYYLGERALALAQALEHLPLKIKHLDLSNVGLADKACVATIGSVLQNTTIESDTSSNILLEKLNLSDNNIGRLGCAQISQFLLDSHAQSCLHIRDMNLAGNRLGSCPH